MVGSVLAVPAIAQEASVSSSGAPSSADQGTTFTIEYTVTNTGDSDASSGGFEITNLPDGLDVTDHEGDGSAALQQNAVFFTGGIPAGESMTFTLTYSVDSDASTGDATITGEATVGDDTATVSDTVSIDEAGDGTPTDTPTPEPGLPDHDADLETGGTYWAGQTLLRSAGVNANEELEVWALDADGNKDQLVDQPIADADGNVLIGTSGLDGRYLLEDSDDNVIADNWLVTTQNLDVGFAASSVTDEGATELEFDSNRGNYHVSVSADGLSEDDLLGIFADATEGAEAGDGAVQLQIRGDPAIDADFDGVAVDEYDFTVTVTDTGVEDTASIEVVDAGEAGASFASPKTFQQERGDTLAFTVNLRNTNSATVVVGSEAVNYEVELTVSDAASGDDADGTVTVLMDTYRAGGWAGDSAADVYAAADSGDSVTATRNTGALSQPLSDGDYGLEVLIDDEQEDGGSVFLLQRSTDSVTLHTAPQRASFDDVDELLDAATETDEVATGSGDWLIVQVQASGIYEYVESVTDLTTDNHGVTLTVTQTSASTRSNADPIEVDLGGATLLTDAANDQFFLAVQADWADVDAGQSYDATFTISDANPYVAAGASESVSATADVTAGTVAIDTNVPNEDRLVIPSDSESDISGTSSWAPGTSVTVVVESGSSDNPYFERQSTTVSADGTWTTTFDTSDLPEGVELSVSARRTGAPTAGDSVDAEIGTPPTPEPPETVIVTRTVQVDSPTPRVVTEEVEVTRQVEVEVEVTRTVIKEVEVTQTPGQPGFGIAVAILALLAAAMLALRRRD